MSDEQKETGKEPSKTTPETESGTTHNTPEAAAPRGASPDTAAKSPAGKPAATPAKDAAVSAEKPAAPAAAAKAEAAPPPPPEPGVYGQRLKKAGLNFTPLGNDATGVEEIDVPVADALKVAQWLRDEGGFDLLLDCCGVDWKDRLESVYHFYNTKTHEFLAVKITAGADEHSPSLFPVYPAADWHERETYDLFGIQYDGHPNLSRILMPSDWLGYPLRKDYKVDDPRLVWNER